MARILVVDDDADIRNMIREMLERSGHDIIEAQDGNEAVPMFLAAPTDLVITNILMPEKEGLETIQDIRRNHRDVKIIAISGGGQVGPADYLEAARRIGANATLAKPFERRALVELVDGLLANPDHPTLGTEAGEA